MRFFAGMKTASLVLSLVGLLLIGTSVYITVAPQLRDQPASTIESTANDSGEIIIEEEEIPMASSSEISAASGFSAQVVAQGLGASGVVAGAAAIAVAIDNYRRKRI